MSKKVSSKTHTKQQLDNYANQNNPNSKAYKANVDNHNKQISTKRNVEKADNYCELEWFQLSNPFDFD